MVLQILASTYFHKRQIFTGNGSTLTFTVTEDPIEDRSEMVFLTSHGYQERDVHYTIDADQKTIRFVLPPLNTEKVVIYYRQKITNNARILPDNPTIAIRGTGTVHRRQIFTGDGVTVAWVLSGPIDKQGECLLSQQHGYYERGAHYTVAADRKTITFTLPQLNGEKVVAYFVEAEG